MLRKGRGAEGQPVEKAKFTLAKAMILATTEFRQRDGVNSAASYLMDGHSVDLSQELVEQRPSIARSNEWDTTPIAQTAQSTGAAATIRVCWQCPEESTAFKERQQ